MTESEHSPPPAASRPAQSDLRPTGWFLLLLVVGGLLYAVSFVPRTPSSAESRTGVGKPLAAFQLQALTGTSQPLEADNLAGRVVLLNFWGTWCPPCTQEFPHLVKLIWRFEDQKDFLPLLVSCGNGGPEQLDDLRSATARFLEQHRYNVPTYADLHLATRNGLVKTADMRGYPFTVVLDRHSTIRGVWEGYEPQGPQQMADLVDTLLRSKE